MTSGKLYAIIVEKTWRRHKNGTKDLYNHYVIHPQKKRVRHKASIVEIKVEDSGKRPLRTYVYDQEIARKNMTTMIIMYIL